MGVKYEISAMGEKYTNQNGEEKTRYVRMGVVLETRNGGLMLKVEAIPVGWNGMAFLNTPREKDGTAPAGNGGGNGGGNSNHSGGFNPDDDIPF